MVTTITTRTIVRCPACVVLLFTDPFKKSSEMGVAFLMYKRINAYQQIDVKAKLTGNPYMIQSKKLIFIPASLIKPATTGFVEFAMIVPIPPTAAAIETPNNNDLLIFDLPKIVNKGVMAATIIEVVADSDITIEDTMAVSIKAIRIFLGLLPDNFSVKANSLMSRPVFLIAAAMKKPPSKSQITLLEKVLTYLSIFSGAELRWGLPNVKTR